MHERDWKDGDHEVYYFFNTADGRIVGQINKIVHTKIWVSKIYKSPTEEAYLGQYISYEFAKKSVETYWIIQERTLIE
jgi:hypothetical protein